MAAVADLNLGFRHMTSADLDRVMEIETRAYAFPWSRGIFADCIEAGYSCWVLLRDEYVVGHAVLNKGVDEVHLLNVCVQREAQGRGLGRVFVRHLIHEAQTLGGDYMFLEVRPSNRKALRLYDSLGFVEVGRRPEYYPGDPKREDALVLSLALASF